ncbi:MAG: hypothetical protein COV08_00965 [Candidatus Vogelbacteria bacterium CG10_big_fil_rev_8_21_14_0_10_49_38]|uniref:DNA-directed DNA polymerase n=1 Tax=Candidatus Vogelbacteria bacterium CG10_big_fil_rev_8_21_14_0_10_49_38 TaxID=1975043 RepID=A0A2H0RJR1_9BACT|nr:MAG: hypothetical protein BK006_00970 [bacterium CG10_49_38]PIR46244.1 MAG: hypothetical protein COV08_00965 [Candidatus Vogelbacteria bacterium CG10_big_fil_rev_8_21_14_0_10_49_38]
MTKTQYQTKVVLIDAHAILHRAYHALPDFTSSKGEPTGGLYGLASMLIKIITDLKPDHLVACYDRAEPTFRKQIYDDYKAKRPKAEPELVAQIIRSREIFTALGIPIYDKPGFEADDIIGTITARLAKEKDVQVVIASGDMDTLQLTEGDKVVVFTLKKGLNDTIVYNEAAVRARFGFAPKLLVDYKGLRGDPSDNIIGIEGIGEKTATILIQTFGSIEEIYQAIKTDKQKLLAQGIKPRIVELLKANEEEALFSKTLASIRQDVDIDFVLPARTWTETFDSTPAEKLFAELEFRTLITRVKKLASSNNPDSLVEAEREKTNDESEEKEEVWPEALTRELAIGLWLLNSDLVNPTQADLVNYTNQADPVKAKEKILADLKQNNLLKVYEEIELPLIPILDQARNRGIRVDRKLLADLSRDYHRQLVELETRIYGLVGRAFNLNSPKQLGEILFQELGLSAKGLKKTAGGGQSTRESELVKLKNAHPVVSEILDYREIQKIVSTYLDALPKLLDQTDTLHTTLNQIGTTTGRMSSSNPNLQNIPNRGQAGLSIRSAFVARPGFELLALDYSQIELRVLAVLSGDPDLIEIFRAGKDIHASVAARVFGVKEEEVTKEMRQRAKVINFGIIYGMGVNALQANLRVDREEAKKFQENYFASFSTIKNYLDGLIVEAGRLGYTETKFGRRRYLPALKSPLPQIKAGAERMAMNAPIQGTAADIIKLAMIKADQDLRSAGLSDQGFLLLQIHDELIYEVKTEVVTEAENLIKQDMETVVDWPVPLEVSSAVGANWGQLDK